MKISKYLTEKRGDTIYVLYDEHTKRVISATDNIDKLLEIINRATGGQQNKESLARLLTRGKDDFGKGNNKVVVFKTIMM